MTTATTAACRHCRHWFTTRETGAGTTRRTVVRAHTDMGGRACPGSLEGPWVDESERWSA